MKVHYQDHGYRAGHELLNSSISLAREAQDLVDRLSDLSGPLRPGELFEPYITTYPLPGAELYVVAKTWQDLDAPRAGCVLTKSLFIPMSTWQLCQAPQAFVVGIERVDREPASRGPIEVDTSTPSLPPIEAEGMEDLVQALFLEERRPLALFDFEKADVISLRLLAALWPALRSRFAVCSYALAPRSTDRRPFDLVFAPKSARQRYAEWPGRRMGTSASTGRHRWSRLAAQNIFVRPLPTLLDTDELGLLRSDDAGDESALRLSFLWAELQESVKRTPDAVLGLLDILSSQDALRVSRSGELRSEIVQSVDLAARNLLLPDRWTFLTALAEKLSVYRNPLSVLRSVVLAVRHATRDDPPSALTLLARQGENARAAPHLVTCGIADQIAREDWTDDLLLSLRSLPPHLLLAMAARSSEFSRRFVDTAAIRDDLLDRFLSGAAHADSVDRSRVRRRMVPQLSDAMHVPFIVPLMKGAEPAEITGVISSLWEKSFFACEEFDSEFVQALKGRDRMNALRKAIISVGEGKPADRFLVATLRPMAADIQWLGENLTRYRASRVAAQMVAMFGDDVLERSLDAPREAKLLLELLQAGTDWGADETARVVLVGVAPLMDSLEAANRIATKVSRERAARLGSTLLARIFRGDGDLTDIAVAEFFVRFGDVLNPDEVLSMAFARQLSSNAVEAHLRFLAHVGGELRRSIVSRVDVLCDLLTSQRRINGLAHDAILAWAQFIDEAVPFGEAQRRAAARTLTYAFRHTGEPVGRLVVAAFPVVYADLMSGREAPPALSLFRFIDWDRCRVARRELIDCFLRGVWRPIELLATAIRSGDVERILDDLSESRRGAKYIEAIEEELSKLSDDVRQEFGLDRLKLRRR